MANTNGKWMPPREQIDYNIHGLVGIRLINPAPGDAAAVARQLGPLQSSLSREPDIVIRFVKHLPTPGLRYLGLNKSGFTDDDFFILRSGKREAKVKIAFDKIGHRCEIVCESGLRSVPLLMAILNLTVLKHDCVPLHASAFVYADTGVLVTGWAKGGKTEALLAFAARGARYVGDEWILLSGDGRKMYGIPENMRLWDWHLDRMPHLRRRVKRERLLLFKAIHKLDALQRRCRSGWIGKSLPMKYLREAMPALKRQLNARMPPQAIFGSAFGPLQATPQKVFLLMSHDQPGITIAPVDPVAIARQMISSIRYEQLPFMEHYLAFKFAFPGRQNDFIERAHELQYDILCRALSGKEAYVVQHPYPFSFEDLYKAMRPFCESSTGRPHKTEPVGSSC